MDGGDVAADGDRKRRAEQRNALLHGHGHQPAEDADLGHDQEGDDQTVDALRARQQFQDQDLGELRRILRDHTGGRLAGEVDAKNTSQEEIMTLAAKYV